MSSTSKPGKGQGKKDQKSLVIILRIPSHRLEQIVGVASAAPSSTSASVKPDASPVTQGQVSSESNATPNPVNAAEVTADANASQPANADGKKKKGGTTTTGRKRAPPSIDPNAPMRERGRPGPKKKPRLADGTIDRTTSSSKQGPAGGTHSGPTHKLGPKANTGAINANLRALDRTKKPTRKWIRKGLQLKSFTGAVWNASSWKTPMRDSLFTTDVKSDSTGSSEAKPIESSAVASEGPRSAVDLAVDRVMTGVNSSPAPQPAAVAA